METTRKIIRYFCYFMNNFLPQPSEKHDRVDKLWGICMEELMYHNSATSLTWEDIQPVFELAGYVRMGEMSREDRTEYDFYLNELEELNPNKAPAEKVKGRLQGKNCKMMILDDPEMGYEERKCNMLAFVSIVETDPEGKKKDKVIVPPYPVAYKGDRNKLKTEVLVKNAKKIENLDTDNIRVVCSDFQTVG